MTTHQILLSLAIFFSFIALMTNADYSMTVVLNGGKSTTAEGYFCNESDLIKIKSAIGIDDDDRNLQSISNKNFQAFVMDDPNPRELKYKAKCKQYCEGYAPGTCLAPGCKGYRRDKMLRKLSEDSNNQRELTNCAREITSLNTTLSRLSGVSSGCKAYLNKPREITCFDEEKYAAVESFTLWNADTDEMIQEYFKNGDTICSNVKVNIEAVANACVEEIEMELKGPIGVEKEYESSGPYTIFGHSGDDLYGRFLPVGTYTLYTEIEDADIPDARLTFTVKKC